MSSTQVPNPNDLASSPGNLGDEDERALSRLAVRIRACEDMSIQQRIEVLRDVDESLRHMLSASRPS
ncbi:hypothetical protein [Schaalia sp. ZJ1691]|uniref:hypothetical protein n=1 Tax=Schaalia sp. ZJ1691 TaxID=2709404 RepID=UPI0013EBA495|nr:hypothetical protein [Schaalia sp. ZJ1691]